MTHRAIGPTIRLAAACLALFGCGPPGPKPETKWEPKPEPEGHITSRILDRLNPPKPWIQTGGGFWQKEREKRIEQLPPDPEPPNWWPGQDSALALRELAQASFSIKINVLKELMAKWPNSERLRYVGFAVAGLDPELCRRLRHEHSIEVYPNGDPLRIPQALVPPVVDRDSADLLNSLPKARLALFENPASRKRVQRLTPKEAAAVFNRLYYLLQHPDRGQSDEPSRNVQNLLTDLVQRLSEPDLAAVFPKLLDLAPSMSLINERDEGNFLTIAAKRLPPGNVAGEFFRVSRYFARSSLAAYYLRFRSPRERTSSPHPALEVPVSLALLASRMEHTQAIRAFETILTIIRDPRTGSNALSLGPVLAALSGRLDSKDAPRAFVDLLQLMRRPTAPPTPGVHYPDRSVLYAEGQRSTLEEAMPEVALRAAKEDAASLFRTLIDPGLYGRTYRFERAVSTIARQLQGDQAVSLARQVLAGDWKWEGNTTRTILLLALSPRLGPKRVTRLLRGLAKKEGHGQYDLSVGPVLELAELISQSSGNVQSELLDRFRASLAQISDPFEMTAFADLSRTLPPGPRDEAFHEISSRVTKLLEDKTRRHGFDVDDDVLAMAECFVPMRGMLTARDAFRAFKVLIEYRNYYVSQIPTGALSAITGAVREGERQSFVEQARELLSYTTTAPPCSSLVEAVNQTTVRPVLEIIKWPTCSPGDRVRLIEKIGTVVGRRFTAKAGASESLDLFEFISWAKSEGLDLRVTPDRR